MKYDVTKYGILGDGVTNNTKSIKKLVSFIRNNGGGMIYFPCGEYITGSIRLYSNMTLYVDSGATIVGSDNFADYPMISQEDAPGYTRDGYCGLITAFHSENIVIEGNGKIDARGYLWWKTVPSDLVRPRTINPVLCKNIKINNITVVNSPCWTLHPMCCENVLIDGVSVINPYDSPNTDGINPESCKNVRISNCFIDVGDDCVTIKAGTEEDLLQKQYPCENITITNCNMAHGHGGVVIGSEMSGGVKNVTISNCVFQNTDRGIRIKTRRKRGGSVESIIVSNIVMENVLAAITVNEYYCCGADLSDEEIFTPKVLEVTKHTPVISGININGIICRNIVGVGIHMYGLPEKPISDITISNIDIRVSGCEKGIEAILAINHSRAYGEGIYLENAEEININNVHITCPKEKITTINCKDIEVNGHKVEN